MLLEDKDGVSIRCDKCGSRMILAANPMQPAASRMPSGWMRGENQSHTCPLCSRRVLSSMHTHR